MALRRTVEITDKIGFYGVDIFDKSLLVRLYTGVEVNGNFIPDSTKKPQEFCIKDEPEQIIMATVNIVNGTTTVPSVNGLVIAGIYTEGVDYTVSGLVLTSINMPDGTYQIQYTKPAIPRFSRIPAELLADVVARNPTINRYDDNKNRIWAELIDMGVVPAGSFV